MTDRDKNQSVAVPSQS